MNYSKFSDRQIYKLCRKWGAEALEARRKFAGLLPEVQKRELTALSNGKSWLEKRGYGSVHHFAAKLAGMSREQVDMVLRLERRFEDKPVLHDALTTGKISANKLVRIASIATVENQAQLAEKIAPLSQAGVEVFVRDFKNENGLCKSLEGRKSLRAQSLELARDVEERLLEMQEKGIDINAFLRGALEKRQYEIAAEKERLALEQGQTRRDGPLHEKSAMGKPVSRNVPRKIVRIIRQEHGTKCSVTGCNREAADLHHEKGFARTQSHDPRFLKPLCEGHHQLAHAGDWWVQKYRIDATRTVQ